MSEPAPRIEPRPEEFRRARAIFELALEWPPAERARLIRDECQGDRDLAQVVEGMLSADATRHALLDGSPALPADRWQAGDAFTERFRIVGLLGRGGMGEVYRAHDLTLGRDVALKVLPPLAAASEGDRLARFAREAQVLASLNHPNIAAIHGVEEAEGVRALVLELVEGATLAERIAGGPLALEDALDVARQIATGLEAAHEQGIVHRDLKPANITRRADGTVKLLDFGLAKVVVPEASASDGLATVSPTVTSPSMVQRGVLLGTAAYMSPEQAKGREADRRGDVWAFGAVLYEMLTGARAFKGNDVPETIAAVLRAEVEWARLPAATPPALRHLLVRCLEREPQRRLRDIGEARIALEDLAAGVSPSSHTPAGPGPPRRWRQAMALGLAAAAGIAAGAFLWGPPSETPASVTRFTLSTPADRALRPDSQSRDLAVTADGLRVVYKGGSQLDRTQLFVHALDELEPVPLTTPGQPKGPFTSPDGLWIGFFEPGPPGAALKKVAIGGGPAIDVSRLDGPSRGATWGPNNVIIAASGATSTGLLRIPAAGGPFEVVTRPDRQRGEADHLYPHILPDGRSVLFTITALSGGFDMAKVAIFDLRSGVWSTLIPGASQAQYLPSGHIVYAAGGALWAVPFDLAALRLAGTARIVVPQVVTLPTGAAEFDVSPDGTLAYVATGGASTRPRTLVWVDRQGRETPIPAPARPYASARLSPDGTRVAVEIEDQENDVWVWHLDRETLTRVTTDPGLDESPIWTSDGSRLVFTSETGGVMGSLFWQRADGSGRPEPLSDGKLIQRATSALSDGSRLLFSEGAGLMSLSLDGRKQVKTLVRLSQGSGDGVVSPDGLWLAYVAIDGSSPNIFVSRFDDPDADRIQVTPAGGTQPRWAPDGRTLLYLALDGTLTSVQISAGAGLTVSRPQQVLSRPYFHGLTFSRGATYDVAPDGQRFLMVKDSESPAARQPTVVVVRNWFEELRRLAPRRP
jgi:eukaryotic-like serine/threonine-protein kinase